MLLAPVSVEEMRAASALSAVTMAVLVGGRLFGRYAMPVRIVFAGFYIAALIALLVWHLVSG